MALGGLSLFGIREGAYGDEEHAHVRDWHDFVVVFAARTLVFFGLTLLQTFVLFYFRDVQKVGNPSAGTALYAFATIGGAVLSSLFLGLLSDRAPRKIVTALCRSVAWPCATIGFALAPELRWMLPFAVLFGIGFGGVISSGWAMAMDAIPKLRDVGRDLGLWGIATSVPNVVAPLVGGWLIGLFHGTRAGYQAVFGLSGLSFALASLAVLRVGRQPISSLWAVPLRVAAVMSNFAWDHLAYRVRHWGKVPRRRGPTLIVANHQHDFESPAIVSTTTVESGPWRHPIFTASSRRMYEPGFLGGPASLAELFAAARQRRSALHLARDAAARKRAGLRELWPPSRGPSSAGTARCRLREIFDERVAARFPARNEELGSLAARRSSCGRAAS